MSDNTLYSLWKRYLALCMYSRDCLGFIRLSNVPFLDGIVLSPGIKIAVKIALAPAFKKLGSSLYEVIMPGCYHVKPWSDDYWECLARHASFTIYHPCGTAKMGPYWDPDAVVDPQLKLVPFTLINKLWWRYDILIKILETFCAFLRYCLLLNRKKYFLHKSVKLLKANFVM